jgi:putative endonuclease
MKPDNRTEKRKMGDMGENIACDFLVKKGFEVIEKNYLRKWGELDIIAKKGSVVHFVEVKTVTHGTFGYRPEDNLHPWKLKRLSRAIQTYLLEKNIESNWQFDVITVKMDMKARKARVELIEDVIL